MSGNDLDKRAEALLKRLDKEAEAGGYHLNPDNELTLDLCRGLIRNQDRYGYISCPCRLADGNRQADLDIICPCDYRDPDLTEYGCCFCGLYVNDKIKRGEGKAQSIPERRPVDIKARPQYKKKVAAGGEIKVWRCTVCGYLCARPGPPEKCPVCKVDKDRFEVFELSPPP